MAHISGVVQVDSKKAKGLVPSRPSKVLLYYLCSSLFLGTLTKEVRVAQQQSVHNIFPTTINKRASCLRF